MTNYVHLNIKYRDNFRADTYYTGILAIVLDIGWVSHERTNERETLSDFGSEYLWFSLIISMDVYTTAPNLLSPLYFVDFWNNIWTRITVKLQIIPTSILSLMPPLFFRGNCLCYSWCQFLKIMPITLETPLLRTIVIQNKSRMWPGALGTYFVIYSRCLRANFLFPQNVFHFSLKFQKH